MGGHEPIRWPDGKTFAFSVFDDTDLATRENVAPVYDLLGGLGLHTTKSVWAVGGDSEPSIGGATCEDPSYRDWTLELQKAGFEIGSHGASPTTATRDTVIHSLDRFRQIYGHDPEVLANHSHCLDSMYWGDARLDGASRVAYNLMTGFRSRGVFRGHCEGDPLFWGDMCRARVRYVRNFTYADIDTLAACPVMPYHDPNRPFVNAWFASSEGADVEAYTRCVSEENQDRLEAGGGACIMYTHFAAGFWRDQTLNPRFRMLMERLSAKNGWFVPVSALLDHVVAQRGLTVISATERRALEHRWLRSKLRVGHS